jgi:hypothetical protein
MAQTVGVSVLAGLVMAGVIVALRAADVVPHGNPMIASTDVREVCATDGLPGSAYSRAHRVVKRRPVPGHQIDHIVPLCLGGADVEANIQVQPIDEALAKDELERSACRAVCAGALDIERAQKFFIEKWGKR